MLDTGPHIHRGCAQLNFHGNGSAFSVSADGHEHHQMQTAVAALLRHGDVVPRADKLPRGRRAQNIRETVHGFHAGKHDAQTGDVVQICRAFRALRQTATSQLVADGRGRLEPSSSGRQKAWILLQAAFAPRRAPETRFPPPPHRARKTKNQNPPSSACASAVRKKYAARQSPQKSI